MDPYTASGLIGLALLILLFFTHMPVAFAMVIVGFIGYSYLTSIDAGLALLSRDVFEIFTAYGLTLIPLFVFMGYVAFYSGISGRLYDVAYTFMGRIRGGLAMATVTACMAFGAICGSSPAAAAAMATIALPEMKRYGYGDELATGSVASGGGLGILMPPSTVLIIYGILTQNSIGKLFIGGIIPAVFITFLFVLAIMVYCAIKPDQGPKGERFSIGQMIRSAVNLWETLLTFLVVIGGLFFGFFTPTKAGAVGAFAVLLIAVVQRRLSWQGLINAIRDTLRTSAMIFMLIAGGTIFGHFLTLSRIPSNVALWVGQLDMPGWAIMIVIVLIYFVGGCFLDSMAMIMLTIPIFYPIAMDLKYDPIWFGVMIVLLTQMGVISPPVGVNTFVVNGIAKGVSLDTVFKGVMPFLVALLVGTLIIIAFPEIVTFLPNLVRS